MCLHGLKVVDGREFEGLLGNLIVVFLRLGRKNLIMVEGFSYGEEIRRKWEQSRECEAREEDGV